MTAAGGGVAAAILELTRRTASPELHHHILAPTAASESLLDTSNVTPLPIPRWTHLWRYPLGLTRALDTALKDGPLVLHLHGIWKAPQYLAARWALRNQIPCILSPHNMLTEWFWRQGRLRRLKKSLYWHGMVASSFRRLSWIHALTQSEKKELTNYFTEDRLLVIPNAIDLESADREILEEARRPPAGFNVAPGYLLFLGRFHPVKGLHILIEAYARLRTSKKPKLIIAGPVGDVSYFKYLKSKVSRLRAQQDILLHPPIQGASKWAWLSRARAVCLPSYSEGMSMVALEAMAASTPLVTTFEAGLDDIEEGGGYLSHPDPNELEAILSKVVSWSDSDRRRRGSSARALVVKRYSWKVVAPLWLDLYTRLVQNTSKL
jgi:glycosyltransferase involved in cell wall biosynthesis